MDKIQNHHLFFRKKALLVKITFRCSGHFIFMKKHYFSAFRNTIKFYKKYHFYNIFQNLHVLKLLPNRNLIFCSNIFLKWITV